jgi:general secretion pathway protein F
MQELKTDITTGRSIRPDTTDLQRLSQLRKSRSSPVAREPVKKAVLDEDLFVRIKSADLCVCTRQLATLLQAGMNLAPALAALTEQFQGQPLSAVIRDVHEQVQSGESLSDAVARHPKIFSSLYVNLTRAGEASGSLDRVLLDVAEMMENRSRLSSKVKAALIYPALMAVVAAAVVMFLLAYVIPSISEIFLEMNQELPTITLILISISGFIKSHFWLIVIATVVIAAFLRMWLRSDAGHLKWDTAKLQLPLMGDFFQKVEAIRFTRTLSVLLKSGMGIVQALGIVKEVVQNRLYMDRIEKMRQSIADGETIANAIRRSEMFAPIVFHSVHVGEMSGKVEEGLTHLANAYDEELQRQAKALTTLLEPMVMISMGIVVGFIVLAMLLPIFEINQMI